MEPQSSAMGPQNPRSRLKVGIPSLYKNEVMGLVRDIGEQMPTLCRYVAQSGHSREVGPDPGSEFVRSGGAIEPNRVRGVEKAAVELICPHCGGELRENGGSLICSRGHTMNIARQGAT